MDWMGLCKGFVSLTEGIVQPWMDDVGVLDAMHAAAIFQSWMKDGYDGSYQEYNDTIIPIALYVIRPFILFNLKCYSLIVFT